MPHKSLMHHDIQKIISYHNFYLFFPICKRKEFKLFQLLESFKKKVLMHCPSIKKSVGYVRPIILNEKFWDLSPQIFVTFFLVDRWSGVHTLQTCWHFEQLLVNIEVVKTLCETKSLWKNKLSMSNPLERRNTK